MSKFGYERGGPDEDDYDYDLDFDPDATSEPINSRNGPRRGKSGGVKPKAPKITARLQKPYEARRVVIGPDRQLVFNAVGRIVSGRKPEGIGPVADWRDMAAEVLPLAQAQEIFTGHFRRAETKMAALNGFNNVLLQYADLANRRHPSISAQVGELTIVGAEDPRQPDAHYVALNLTGAGAEELINENLGFVTALGSSALCSPDLDVERFTAGYTPSIKLATAPNREGADALLEVLETGRTAAAIRSRLVLSHNSEPPLITMGHL